MGVASSYRIDYTYIIKLARDFVIRYKRGCGRCVPYSERAGEGDGTVTFRGLLTRRLLPHQVTNLPATYSP